jgi:hypothetical protein
VLALPFEDKSPFVILRGTDEAAHGVIERQPAPDLIRGGYWFVRRKRVETRIQNYGFDSIRTDQGFN